VVEGERWILDGNFLPEDWNPDIRFERTDSVVFLDLPRSVCIWRVLKRRVRDRCRSRPDLPASEGFDVELLRWIWRYPAVDRPRVLALLDQLPESVAVHHLRTPADVRAFLESSQRTSSR
jgi:adenylate kinase family enzyme